MFRKIITSFLSLSLVTSGITNVVACQTKHTTSSDNPDVATKIKAVIEQNKALFCSANNYPPGAGSADVHLINYLKRTLINLSTKIYPRHPLTVLDLTDWIIQPFTFTKQEINGINPVLTNIRYFDPLTKKQTQPINLPINYWTNTHFADQIANKIYNLNFLTTSLNLDDIKTPNLNLKDPETISKIREDIKLLNPHPASIVGQPAVKPLNRTRSNPLTRFYISTRPFKFKYLIIPEPI